MQPRLLVSVACLTALVLNASGAQGPRWEHLSSAAGELPPPNGGKQQTACVVFDIDGDRKNDIVLAERTQAPALIWLRRTPPGWTKYVLDDTQQHPEAGGVNYDVDDDGDQDLIIGGDYQSSELWWYENPFPNYDPVVPWKRHLIKSGGGSRHHDQAIGDFKGTGRPQLAFWNQGARKLYLADIPEDARTSERWPLTEIWSYTDKDPGQEGMYVYDVDQDGKPDLLAGNHWFKHVRGSRFTPIEVAKSGGRVLAAEFRYSRFPQIVIAPGDGTGPLMLYDCKGKATDPTAWAGRDLLGRNVVHGHSLQVGDINNDGKLDLFCAEMAKWTESRRDPDNPNAKAWILYGDGKAGFTVTEFSTGIGFHEARLFDLDGDGKLDILDKPYNWQAPRWDLWLAR